MLYVVHLVAAGASRLLQPWYLLFRLAPAANVPAGVAVVAPARWVSLPLLERCRDRRSGARCRTAGRRSRLGGSRRLPLPMRLLVVFAAVDRCRSYRPTSSTRPAAAAGFAVAPTGAPARSESPIPVLPGVARDALWFTLVPALMLGGPSFQRPVRLPRFSVCLLSSSASSSACSLSFRILGCRPLSPGCRGSRARRSRAQPAFVSRSRGRRSVISAALLAAYYSAVRFRSRACCLCCALRARSRSESRCRDAPRCRPDRPGVPSVIAVRVLLGVLTIASWRAVPALCSSLLLSTRSRHFGCRRRVLVVSVLPRCSVMHASEPPFLLSVRSRPDRSVHQLSCPSVAHRWVAPSLVPQRWVLIRMLLVGSVAVRRRPRYASVGRSFPTLRCVVAFHVASLVRAYQRAPRLAFDVPFAAAVVPWL